MNRKQVVITWKGAACYVGDVCVGGVAVTRHGFVPWFNGIREPEKPFGTMSEAQAYLERELSRDPLDEEGGEE